MTRRGSIAGSLAILLLAASAASAQDAWIPPKGEFDFTLTYQWIEANRHLFSGFTDPTLTPFEVATGVDRTSNVVLAGVVQSHSAAFDGDLGLTDRIAINGSVIGVSPRYIGTLGHPGSIDDGLFHPSLTDARLGIRYMFGDGNWAFTPFTQFSFPLRDYETLAHAAQGLGLNILELGVSTGRILDLWGTIGFIQGTYGYGFTERTDEDVPLNRSRAILEGGVFLGRFSVLGQTSWRKVHGGIEWSEHAFGFDELFHAHDQLAAVREWRYGGSVTFDVKDGLAVYASLDQFAWGANTHDARALSFGVNLAHQMWGGLTLGR